MANAVSLLWRLDQMGVDVGCRWSDLAETAFHRSRDTTLVFAALHTLAAVVALGEVDTAREMVDELAAKGRGGRAS